MASNLKKYIRTIPDFPHAGIQFRDITTLFNNSKGLRETVDQMADAMAIHNFDQVAGLEARGFMLGAALAYRLELGFTMIRKKGKLPGKTISQDYNLEYGEATLEIHDDAIEPGQKVLLFDDLIATGGTAEAGINLIERLGGKVEMAAFIIDLPELGGRKKIEALGIPTYVLCEFDGL
ncbi:adenine phosphoribosyltransferase [Amylibacter sp.]|jgi:adenine phosphoribosyltransferase|nr:adenine phosphoribosyltransferase [Amylibacter sp.]MDA9369151.1 adenine phosphoribosyltransferase [bacterium]MDA7760384.1 adenine phosphoribosyltransferase [Amylibacter sp.]MDA7846437.1 adenine phosphoribosyltransferase [Amylibacter sp.]MDA8894584.1 adenine phosphoribosyltransferase [Amylibacter sp.]|tara:strand:- start:20 stop:553 length:534 start_codon:yes stop_codon:yes gene_type:complete